MYLTACVMHHGGIIDKVKGGVAQWQIWGFDPILYNILPRFMDVPGLPAGMQHEYRG